MSRRLIHSFWAVVLASVLVVGIHTPPVSAATTESIPFHVNFQAQTTTTPAGYVGDYGQAYDATRGYGWEANSSGAPLSIVGNGRERNVASDKRLDTLIHMQAVNGVTTAARWELNIANGTYDLTIGVGDPSYQDSHDVLNVEGVKVVDFTPTSAQRQTTVTTTATVRDGRLTVDPTGGTNTKIDYIDVTSGGSGGGGQTQPASLRVTSPQDFLGLGSRLIFSTVKSETRAAKSVTLTNSGTGPLHITGLTLGGNQANDFHLVSGQPTNFTLAPNASQSVSLTYVPTGGGYHVLPTYISHATLTVVSNDANAPNYNIGLGGYNAADNGSYWEPSLQDMVNTVGFKDNIAVTNTPQGNSISSSSSPVGDEVVSAYWQRADTTKPVGMYPLAHSSGQASSYPSFGWYAKGSTTANYLYAFPGGSENDGYGENQMLFPGTTTNNRTFSPAGSFGFVDGQGNHSDDTLNNGAAHWHNIRWYQAKDGNGNVIPNSWIVGDDIGSPVNNSAKNWDYQDYVFLVSNAAPDGAQNQPAPGVINQTLGSFPGNAGGIDGTGFTTAQGATDNSKIAFSGGRLNITTSNDSNTSHTNALALGVNAGTRLRIQSRLTGPFNAITAGADQQGIYFGPNAQNYLKAEVEWNATDHTRHLTVWLEQNGSGSIVNTIELPGGNANTIDLRIDLDPSPQDSAHYNGNPTANLSYALNGATTFTNINSSAVTIPGSWITANTPAGIVTSNQQGGSPFTATYANFSVVRN